MTLMQLTPTHQSHRDRSRIQLSSWQQYCLRLGVLLLCLGSIGCTVPAASPDDNSSGPAVNDSAADPNQSEPLPEETNPLGQEQGQMLPITAQVELGGRIVGLEVAQTSRQQAMGLMHREPLADDRGMLFPFNPPEPVRFWMKNVSVPLDMVFVYQGQIIAIANDVPPCVAEPCPTYGPDGQLVDYVIELRGGLADSLGLELGDAVEITQIDP